MKLFLSVFILTFSIQHTLFSNSSNYFFLDTLPQDINGNIYDTIKIGSQTWTMQDLRVTKYNDGTPIPLVTDGDEWSGLATPGHCWYDNDSTTYAQPFGSLYNWYAVETGKLCPTGWHVPKSSELDLLVEALGGEANAINALRDTTTEYWQTSTPEITNSSGFTMLPSGYRTPDGPFSQFGRVGEYWTTSEVSSGKAWQFAIATFINHIARNPESKNYGFSVRCLKNTADFNPEESDQVQYEGRHNILRMSKKLDSLLSERKIRDFLNLTDMHFINNMEMTGWNWEQDLWGSYNNYEGKQMHFISEGNRGAGIGNGIIGYNPSYFGIELGSVGRDDQESDMGLTRTTNHEATHSWGLGASAYLPSPDHGHVFTAALEIILSSRLGGYYQTAYYPDDLYNRFLLRMLGSHYLQHPELTWDSYVDDQNNYIESDTSWIPSREIGPIFAALFNQIYFMHGKEAFKDILASLDIARTQDPEFNLENTFNDPEKVYRVFVRILSDGLKLDITPYLEYWRLPIQDTLTTYMSQYTLTDKHLDHDGDGFSPLDFDFVDNDASIYPDAPELEDGKDNNLNGIIDETVLTETGDQFNKTSISYPSFIKGKIESLDDEDAFMLEVKEDSWLTFALIPTNGDTVITIDDDGPVNLNIFSGSLIVDGETYRVIPFGGPPRGLHSIKLSKGSHEIVISPEPSIGEYGCPGDYELTIFKHPDSVRYIRNGDLEYEVKMYDNLKPQTAFDCSMVEGMTVEECEALKSIYLNNGGPQWYDSRGWMAATDPCYWKGVRCGKEGIADLALFACLRSIEGSLNELDWQRLNNIRNIRISCADFKSDTLPEVFEDYNRLTYLEMIGSKVGGHLPVSLSSAPLKHLDIRSNYITGPIPEEYTQLNLNTFTFDTDKICAPNQTVMDWVNQIPEHSEGIRLCTEIDYDGDGYVSAEDCNDLEQSINPGAEEIADNGIDENCDGVDLITTSIHEIDGDKLMIYPNPFQSEFVIQSQTRQEYQYKVFGMDGRLIQARDISGNTTTVNLSGMQPGIYILQIEIARQIITQKLVKSTK